MAPCSSTPPNVANSPQTFTHSERIDARSSVPPRSSSIRGASHGPPAQGQFAVNATATLFTTAISATPTPRRPRSSIPTTASGSRPAIS